MTRIFGLTEAGTTRFTSARAPAAIGRRGAIMGPLRQDLRTV
ncbi:MAG: hypothetical protein U0361_10070 [Nitrospiraceae bacterium]